jgi:hypothetical protein
VRTNTPLQALVLLNDPVFVEVAHKIALDMVKMKTDKPEERIAAMYKKMFVHPIKTKDLTTLVNLFKKGQSMKTSNKIQGYEWAASAMLNLDEFVTKM